jgi:hypothetical protein
MSMPLPSTLPLAFLPQEFEHQPDVADLTMPKNSQTKVARMAKSLFSSLFAPASPQDVSSLSPVSASSAAASRGDQSPDAFDAEFNAHLQAKKLRQQHLISLTDMQPGNWNQLTKTDEGRITIELHPADAQKKQLIYVFWNTQTNTYLIGKTGTSISGRLSGYLTSFNKPYMGNSPFIEEVQKDPTVFRFGILYELKDGEDLDEYETDFITQKRQKFSLYNQNNGGGGGLARTEEVNGYYAVVNPADITPQRNYSFQQDADGKIRPKFTPGAHRFTRQDGETHSFHYRVKDTETDKRYIGTSNRVIERAQEHGYKANKENAAAAQLGIMEDKGLLHTALAQNPARFVVGFYDIQHQEPLDLDEEAKKQLTVAKTSGQMERILIAAKETLRPNGFNGNAGGGGPIGRQKGKRKATAAPDQ